MRLSRPGSVRSPGRDGGISGRERSDRSSRCRRHRSHERRGSMSTLAYRETHLSAGTRADLLLREMTLDEKCGQLTAALPWSLIHWDGSDADTAEQVLERPPGHVAGLNVDDPAQLANL